jgi:hypothetical protein
MRAVQVAEKTLDVLRPSSLASHSSSEARFLIEGKQHGQVVLTHRTVTIVFCNWLAASERL